MKVVIDLDKLRDEGKISQDQYVTLSQYALQETVFLAFNILVSFGVIAIACSFIALVPTALATIISGIIVGAIGFYSLHGSTKWQLFAHISILLGSLLLSGGILWQYQATISAWVTVTLLLIISGILANSGLLVVLSVLSLAATIGMGTLYEHASYALIISQPTMTILLFSSLSFITYRLYPHIPLPKQRLAILTARTALFLVNLGFWIGSLWGDHFLNHIDIPDWIFSIFWAALLVLVGIWAAKANRRWVLNVCAIFAAIHFYTQWFEYLGANPLTVLLAGLIALIFAFFIQRINSQ